MGNYIHVFLRLNFNNDFKDNNKDNNTNISNNIVSIKNVKKIFKSFNVLDTNKNIIIGIWDNPNKSNTLGNQGIWIGDHDRIYELILGINCCELVILYFENNIVLKITNINNSYILELKNKDNVIFYSTKISENIIEKLIKINKNSLDLDLIFNIIKK